jgi:hypothetical protein
MLLMPKKNLGSFQIQRIREFTATVKQCVGEHLDPFKAEPENKDRHNDLLNFRVELLVTIEGGESRRAQDTAKFGRRPHSIFTEDDKCVLIVCERTRKLMGFPLDKTVCSDLRTPIQRTGGIARYQPFLTEALFHEDLTELYHSLDALVGERHNGKTGCDAALLPWTREMFQRTMDSYPLPPQSTMKEEEAVILMMICEWCGPNIYAERYVAPRYAATGQSVLLTFIACFLSW